MTQRVSHPSPVSRVDREPDVTASTPKLFAAPDGTAPIPEDEQLGLEAIDIYIKSQRVGFESDLIFPFTAQQKHNIRIQFPDDAEFYNKYDGRLSSINRLHYSLLSFLYIIIVLCCMSPVFFDVISYYTPPSELISSFPYLIISLSTLFTILGVAGSSIVRAWAKKTEIDPFASDIDHHYNQIMHQISDCEKKVGNRQDLIREPEMSQHWAKIMLWNVLRLRDADRYASIVSWKIFASARNAFLDFASASALLILIGGVVSFSRLPPDASFILPFFSVLVGPIVLVLAGYWGRGLLTTPIKRRTHGLSIDKPFNEFGECVRRVVIRAKASERKQN